MWHLPTNAHFFLALELLFLFSLAAILTKITIQVAVFRHFYNLEKIYFELTPSLENKEPIATEEFFTVLHALNNTRSLRDKIFCKKIILSFEIVSSRNKGIRYVAVVPKSESATFKMAINSYLPTIRTLEVNDYLVNYSTNNKVSRILSFKLSGHFAYPLKSYTDLKNFDQIANITGSMTKLKTGELAVFQFVASPTIITKAHKLQQMIIAYKDTGLGSKQTHKFFTFFKILFIIVFFPLAIIIFLTRIMLSLIFHLDTFGSNRRFVSRNSISIQEKDLINLIYNKVSRPLFNVSVRSFIISNNNQRLSERAISIKSSFSTFSRQGLQSIKPRNSLPTKINTIYREFIFSNRLPSLFNHGVLILDVAELSALYHFPHSQAAKTENVVRSLSRTLPATLSLKNNTKLDVVLGINHHHNDTTSIGLTAWEREKHVYIIGGTGNGKTTMLRHCIVQDIINGKGIAVVDPHGDLAQEVLTHIPSNRINDVIYFNPDDLSFPIGLNLLELPNGLSKDELLREKDFITESVISIMRKMFSDDDSGGHRIEYILRNTIQTALTIDKATLFTIYDLLNNAIYRKNVIKQLTDTNLQNFWRNEFGKAGDFQRIKMTAGITAKIGRFLFSASAKRVIEQPNSTIDFDDILKSGKILICNFSKGKLGEDTSTLFGTTVLAKLQLAALRRARVDRSERNSYFLYVDEFQNFATMSFVQMLSEARKYRLLLTIAEQSPSQQEKELVDIILANIGTLICFRSGSPIDEQLILPLFSPYIESGDILNLPSYNFYARISSIHPQEPLSGQTILLNEPGSIQIAEEAIELSRKHYAIAYSANEPGYDNEPTTGLQNRLPEFDDLSLS